MNTMKTLEEIAAALTSPNLLTALTDLLRSWDEDFPGVERAYREAVQSLRRELPPDLIPTLDDCLCAHELDILSRLVCAGYYGFRMNLENFRHPFGLNLLHDDPVDYTRGHIIGHLPVNEKAETVISAFAQTLPENCVHLCAPIDYYFAYLECDAPKLAHYAGYVISNYVLPWMEPGYRPDVAQTSRFAIETMNYLGFLPQ